MFFRIRFRHLLKIVELLVGHQTEPSILWGHFLCEKPILSLPFASGYSCSPVGLGIDHYQ